MPRLNWSCTSVSVPLGVSDIDSLKDGVKSELATKQYQIQGQDGQSYLLTVAGKCQRKYRVSDIDSLKDGVKSELATKQYQIQGQDGQSYLLTVAGKFKESTAKIVCFNFIHSG